jgi:hypothetical protein
MQANAAVVGKPYGHDVAEALTAFLSIPDPLGDETREAIQEGFDNLDWRLSAPRRKFRGVEGVASGLTNVMAWDGWQQRSSSTPRLAASSSAGRRA